MADQYKVSRLVIARKLRDMRLISQDDFWGIYNRLNMLRSDLPAKAEGKSGGPNKNVVDGYRLGDKLMRRILEAADEGIISYSEASRVLNLSSGKFDKVLV